MNVNSIHFVLLTLTLFNSQFAFAADNQSSIKKYTYKTYTTYAQTESTPEKRIITTGTFFHSGPFKGRYDYSQEYDYRNGKAFGCSTIAEDERAEAFRNLEIRYNQTKQRLKNALKRHIN